MSLSLSSLKDSLRAAIDPVAVPSVAYGIARGEETLLLGAAGLADKDGLQARVGTPYSLASVTKPMTAMAVLRLAECGLVDLDAPVDDYLRVRLDGKAGDRREATVRRVLDHTAGLSLHYRFYYADEDEPRVPFDDVIRHYGKLFSPPGERHHYSNLGYGLLDDLIARVAGMPYEAFMDREVFGPLGMGGASIGALPGAAVAYGPDGVGYPATTSTIRAARRRSGAWRTCWRSGASIWPIRWGWHGNPFSVTAWTGPLRNGMGCASWSTPAEWAA